MVRLPVALPPVELEPFIPASRFNPRGFTGSTLRKLEEEAGGPGWYNPGPMAERDLPVEEWNHDIIPKILNGRLEHHRKVGAVGR
jgi:hypothetical protein